MKLKFPLTIKTAVMAAAVALFLGATLSAQTLDIYVLTGQSNSLGNPQNSFSPSDLGSDPSQQDNASGVPNVPFWFNDFSGYNTPVVAGDTSTAWSPIEAQPGDTAIAAGDQYWVGPEVGFAETLYADGNTNFAVVKASRDGGSGSLWEGPSLTGQTGPPATGSTAAGSAYWSVIQTIQAATTPSALASLGYTNYQIVGVMYLQGESDTATDATNAVANLESFVSGLESTFSGHISTNVPVVIGQNLSTASNRIYGTSGWQGSAGANSPSGVANTNLYNLTLSDPSQYGWVPTSDLNIDNEDGLKIHADYNSQLTIGDRFADEFITMGVAVPEPSTVALTIIFGVGMLMLFRRRRQHHA